MKKVLINSFLLFLLSILLFDSCIDKQNTSEKKIVELNSYYAKNHDNNNFLDSSIFNFTKNRGNGYRLLWRRCFVYNDPVLFKISDNQGKYYIVTFVYNGIGGGPFRKVILIDTTQITALEYRDFDNIVNKSEMEIKYLCGGNSNAVSHPKQCLDGDIWYFEKKKGTSIQTIIRKCYTGNPDDNIIKTIFKLTKYSEKNTRLLSQNIMQTASVLIHDLKNQSKQILFLKEWEKLNLILRSPSIIKNQEIYFDNWTSILLDKVAYDKSLKLNDKYNDIVKETNDSNYEMLSVKVDSLFLSVNKQFKNEKDKEIIIFLTDIIVLCDYILKEMNFDILNSKIRFDQLK